MSAVACTREPVSWLRLERYALGELGADAARAIEVHVAECAACRGCLERIWGDDRPLPRLVLPEPARRSRWWRAWPVWGGALLAAAAALLFFVLRPGDVPDRAAGPRVAIKGGGELVVSLVRERGGATQLDASDFAAGDRFKLRVTCGQATRVHADVVVFQDGEAAFPLPPAELACGNQTVLPGAFTITGTAPAVVCVAVDRDRPRDRAALAARGPRGPGLGCVALAYRAR